MNFQRLVKLNLTYYWRTNLAVILGVGAAVAVLSGALLVGDSVRGSLRELALSRLGKTDSIISASGLFREQLAVDLQSDNRFNENFDGACPLLALEGMATRDENNARAGDVQVYGVDERFWKFHGASVQPPQGNDVLLSHALGQELGVKAGETIILRIEKPSAIPVESLHGRKDDPGSTIRFTARDVLPASAMGEFSLRPQQGAVRALFVPLRKLQRNLEQEGKANVILLSAKNTGGSLLQPAADMLKDKFALADLGLMLRKLDEQRAISLESDGSVITDILAEKARGVAEKQGLRAADVLTYLANTIRIGERQIPYSLVTALDEKSLALLSGKPVEPSATPALILNEWAANDLAAKPGDRAILDYYLWREEGRLETEQAQFQIAAVVPMRGAAADRNYAPDYPGITDTDSLADWDPPFPIDLSRIRPKDEEYWKKYRTTPKAFIRLDDGQKLWASRYGKLTSIRMIPAENSDLETTLKSYEQSLRASLDPEQLGLSVRSIKEESMQASRGATDFGEYFTYFSFFLVISALLLTTLFFKLGVEQRLREIGLLRAIGFSIEQIRSIFLREGMILSALGGALGLVGAIAYGGLMMWGLRTWWVGAVGTTLLRLHIVPRSLFIGGIAGMLTALAWIWWTLRGLTPTSPRSLLSGEIGAQPAQRGAAGGVRRFITASRLAVFFGGLGLFLLAAALLKLIGQVGGFFGAGALILISLLFVWAAWLRSDKKKTIEGHGLWPMARLGFRNASSRPGRAVLCIALIASAAFIIVSVDAFRRGAGATGLDKKSGTGGYPLMAESLLPIVRDLNGDQGREELNLMDDALREVKIARFRLRPGDDASCLNLYRPSNPRILAPTGDFIDEARFSFQGQGPENPWLLLDSDLGDGVVPVIADANSMTYVLHRKLGDEIEINASDGAPVKLRLVAALSDSIFQSELLMSEKEFLRLFPDQEGFRFFLIDVNSEKAPAIAAILEDKLSDFGFDATSAEEKLAGFHQVENTYLSTFQTLGGLGLLLGTLGLAAVLLRNVLERRHELALMRAVGYRPMHLSLMVIAENALMLGCGLLTGVLSALLAISPAFIARGGRLSAVSLGILLFAVVITGLAASLVAVRAVVRSPLLPSLRTE